MWDKFFTASQVAVVVGLAIFLPAYALFEPPVAVLWASVLLVSIGGFFAGISGFALLLTSKSGTNP